MSISVSQQVVSLQLEKRIITLIINSQKSEASEISILLNLYLIYIFYIYLY